MKHLLTFSAISLVLLNALTASAATTPSVKFLAVGNPSAIRIQGEAKTLESEKTEWKAGKFSGIFHLPMDQLETGISMRDKHMKEKYLETGKYPKADLAIDACEMKADAESTCAANLTLHGVTKPVSLKVKTATAGSMLKVNADFVLKLTDYQIALPTFANIKVAEDVTVQVETETAPAPAVSAPEKTAPVKAATAKSIPAKPISAKHK